ncbi:MAG: hypothetical protein GQ531_03075 [Sulfurovum sp.]|nr:hypothetical protein [Sulfurovum sp.]
MKKMFMMLIMIGSLLLSESFASEQPLNNEFDIDLSDGIFQGWVRSSILKEERLAMGFNLRVNGVNKSDDIKHFGVTISFPGVNNLRASIGKVYPSGSKLWSGVNKKNIISKDAVVEFWDVWNEPDHYPIDHVVAHTLDIDLPTSAKEFDTLNVKIRAIILLKNGKTIHFPPLKNRNNTDQQAYPVVNLNVKVKNSNISQSSKGEDYEEVNNQQEITSRNNISNVETVKAEDLVAFPNDYAKKIINVVCRIPSDVIITYKDSIKGYDINLNCNNGSSSSFGSSMNLAMNLDTVTSKDAAKFIRNNEGKKCIVKGEFRSKDESGSALYTHTLFMNEVHIVE